MTAAFEIALRPEREVIEQFAPNGTDESLHEGMEDGDIRDCLDFVDYEDSEFRLPAMKFE